MWGKNIPGRGENTGPNGENGLERTLREERRAVQLKGTRRKMVKHGAEGTGKARWLRVWGPS